MSRLVFSGRGHRRYRCSLLWNNLCLRQSSWTPRAFSTFRRGDRHDDDDDVCGGKLARKSDDEFVSGLRVA